jgi:hypothetical protein
MLSQVLTLYITPVIYHYLDRLTAKGKAEEPELAAAHAPRAAAE